MKTLFVLLGPTGVGKTELSLSLAEFLRSPIINADSRQIYKEIPIGSAAPTAKEQARVFHYFVGTLSLKDYFSAAVYESQTLALLENYFKDNDVALLSGGSMLYIDAICNGIDDIPTIDDATRSFMKKQYAEKGLESLCKELQLLDPSYYKIVDRKNPKRVVHALEICYMTGKTYTSFRVKKHKHRPFRIVKIGLKRDRELELYPRINERVTKMMKQGLLDEAKRVYPERQLNSLNTVGFKELFKYFDGDWTLDFALDKIRQNSRIYSRKQMTWFRKDAEIQWFHPDDRDEIFNFVKDEMA